MLRLGRRGAALTALRHTPGLVWATATATAAAPTWSATLRRLPYACGWLPTAGSPALVTATRCAATTAATGGAAGGAGSGGGTAAASRAGSTAAAATSAGARRTKVKRVVKKLIKRKKGSGSATAAAGGGSSSSSSSAAAAAAASSAATGAGAHGASGGGSSGSHGGGGSTGPAGGGTVAEAARPVRRKLVRKLKKKRPAAGAATTIAAAATAGTAGPTTGPRVVLAGKKAAGSTRRRPVTSRSGTGSAVSRAGRGGGSDTRRRAAGTGSGGGGSGAGSAASGGGGRTPTRKVLRKKKLRVCVLNSSYDGADSVTAAVDNFLCTPEHYAKKDRRKYVFEDVAVKKIDSFRTVRELITSGKYDVFFNLCDGGRDEKRAGVDVVEALEEMNAAFTGTDSRSFEPSKIDMKLLVGSCGVKVPNFVLLKDADSLAKKCRHLRFPVIVKHLSGYASVGIHKDNRCDDLDQLKKKVPAFVKEFNHALVEEFIRGREGTVLACADTASPHGVKVFRPLMFNFLKDGDDFAYFDKKWGMSCEETAYGFLPASDPAYATIIDMARHAYKYIMNGVGYGRVDFRIDERTGEPMFLEINPNCGMWYSEKDGGDFADIMVQGDPTWNHERFLANAVQRALREQAARRPWYFISHDKTGQFSTRASRTVPEGKCLFDDAVHPIPVVSKALYKLGAVDPTVGCVVCRGDGMNQAVAIRHSCEPNMQFVHGRTLLFAAKRPINVGEELTVDYATLRDEQMPAFACSCGTQNCRSVIFAMPATARTLELKAASKMLREKKRLWLKERLAEREAERLLKKRAAASAGHGHGHSSGGGSGSSSHGGGSGAGSGSSGSHGAGHGGDGGGSGGGHGGSSAGGGSSASSK